MIQYHLNRTDKRWTKACKIIHCSYRIICRIDSEDLVWEFKTNLSQQSPISGAAVSCRQATRNKHVPAFVD